MLLVVFILCVIRSVQTFDEIYVLTGGGPGSATMLMVQYIYEVGFAAQPRNFGLAAAASLLLGRRAARSSPWCSSRSRGRSKDG